ncbi:MAG: helix-turn-helix transcriptional regulator [Flavobacteriaceae bacterium]|jgi:transcriptional regulator with XRE-family HTH domain|nr:helix-turn-helix transcriptional regulator [Flavobacteriaceae bacterium]
MNYSIGSKIKQLREQQNISQKDLAYELEVSQGYLSKIESGEIEKMDFLFMQKIAEFFKVEPQYFLEKGTIVNDVETSNHSAVGYISTLTINNNFSEDLLKKLIDNQSQISKLMEMQNNLIENLLKK